MRKGGLDAGVFVDSGSVGRRSLRHLVGLLVSAALAATTLVVLPSGPASAAAPPVPPVINYNDPSIVDPSYVLDLANPKAPNLTYKPGLVWLENQAVTDVIVSQGLDSADRDAVRSWARDNVRAQMWTLLSEIMAKTTRTAEEQLVYDWFARVMQKQFVKAAEYAVDEYERYSGHSLETALAGSDPVPFSPDGTGYCTYRMPEPYTSQYTGYTNASCLGVPLYPGPDFLAPTIEYEDLVAIGTQRMVGELMTDADTRLRSISMGTASAITIAATLAAAGVVIPITSKLGKSTLTLQRIVKVLWPHLARATWKPATKFIGPITKAAAKAAAKAATAVTRTVLKAFTAIVGVAIDFIITTILTSIDLANQLDLPVKLNSLRSKAKATPPDIKALSGDDAQYAGMYTSFLLLTADDADPNCTDGDIVVRDNPWDIVCLNAPTPKAEVQSDPVWEITPEGGAPYLSATLAAGTPFSETLVSRASGKGWWVSQKLDPETGAPEASLQTLQLPYRSWGELPYLASRIWDATNGYRFVITPIGDAALPTECDVAGACVLSSLKLVDINEQKLSVRLVTRPTAQPAQVLYLPNQTFGQVATYRVLNPVPGTVYSWEFPCAYGSGVTLSCGPSCEIKDANGLCIDYSKPTAYGSGTTINFDWRLEGARTFKVTSTIPGVSTTTRTYGVTVTKQTNTLEFPQPPDQVYGYSPALGSKKVTVDVAASSLLPVTLTAAAASAGICSASGRVVTLLAAGTCTVTATQPGDSMIGNVVNFNSIWGPAAPVTRSFTITKADLPVVITRNPVQYSDPMPAANQVLTPTALYGVTGSLTGCTPPDWLVSTNSTVVKPAGTYRLADCGGFTSPGFTITHAGSVTVLPETAVLQDVAVPQTQAFTARLAAQLVQQADGAPGDPSLATVDFLLFTGPTSGQPDWAAYGVPVSATGRATVDLPGIDADSYTVVARISPSSTYFAADPLQKALIVPSVSTTATALTLADPGTITFGGTAALKGTLKTSAGTAVPGATVKVFRKPYGATTWSALATVTTTSTGAFALSVKPSRQTSYYVAYVGSPPLGSATSTVRTAKVRNAVSIAASDTTPAVGQRVAFTGKVGPAQAGKRVYLQRYIDGAWKTVTSALLSSTSTYRLTWVPPNSTDRSFRVLAPAGSGLVTGTSKSVRLTVG